MGLAKGREVPLRLRREPKATNDALIRPDSIDLLATGQSWASAVRRFAPPRTRRDPRPYLKAAVLRSLQTAK